MAGIGFRIQKLLDRDTYLGAVQAYLLGAFVAAGPMLILIFAIGVLSLLCTFRVDTADIALFRVTLVYVYGISLVGTGLLQMNATRYVADLLHKGDTDKVLPSLVGLLVVVSLMNLTLGLAVFGPAGVGAWYLYRAVSLLVLVGNIWIVMIYITATKQYLIVALTFVIGCILAIFLGDRLGEKTGIVGYLEGYTIGQGMIFIVLLVVVARTFPCKQLISFQFFRSFLEFPALAVTGFAFVLGLWIDKVVLWFTPYGETTTGHFRSFDMYDSATFLAYVSTIPSLTYFLVRVETDFYVRYRRLYAVITHQGDLREIETAARSMLQDLVSSVVGLVRLQVLVTLIFLIAASPIMKFLAFSPKQWGMFRIAILGSMLLVLLQILMTIMLYFELRRETVIVAISYVVGNAGLTLRTYYLGYDYLGYGFTAAALLSLVLAFWLAHRGLEHVVYRAFMLQPIPRPRPAVA